MHTHRQVGFGRCTAADPHVKPVVVERRYLAPLEGCSATWQSRSSGNVHAYVSAGDLAAGASACTIARAADLRRASIERCCAGSAALARCSRRRSTHNAASVGRPDGARAVLRICPHVLWICGCRCTGACLPPPAPTVETVEDDEGATDPAARACWTGAPGCAPSRCRSDAHTGSAVDGSGCPELERAQRPRPARRASARPEVTPRRSP